jgi:hypothetical protein
VVRFLIQQLSSSETDLSKLEMISWLGSGVDLNVSEKTEIQPLPGIKFHSPGLRLVTLLTVLSWLPIHHTHNYVWTHGQFAVCTDFKRFRISSCAESVENVKRWILDFQIKI